MKTRPVTVFGREKNQAEKVELFKGRFHGWWRDSETIYQGGLADEAVTHYWLAAIIEKPDGTVYLENADLIRFDDTQEKKECPDD